MEGHIQRLIREVQKKARWVGGLLKMRLHGQFYLPIRKTPERSVSVKWELVQIFLVLDTDIEATANQRWTSDGAPHVFRVAIATQWRRSLCSLCSSSFQLIIKYLGVCRVNALPFLSEVTADTVKQHSISTISVVGRMSASPKVRVRAVTRHVWQWYTF